MDSLILNFQSNRILTDPLRTMEFYPGAVMRDYNFLSIGIEFRINNQNYQS